MCVWMLTGVEQVVTAAHRDLWSCKHRSTVPKNPDRMPKTRSLWPSFLVIVTCRKKWAWIGIFNPAEPHSPWDAGCLYVFSFLYISCLGFFVLWLGCSVISFKPGFCTSRVIGWEDFPEMTYNVSSGALSPPPSVHSPRDISVTCRSFQVR